MRKVAFILLLTATLIAFFYIRSIILKPEERPSILDRMPSGDYIGKVQLLDVARESSSMLYYNKIPFRDICSPEFLLAQAKSYGLDLIKPAYFFANKQDEYGIVFEVSDSSKLYPGIMRIKKNTQIKDTIVGTQKAYKLKNNLFITYGKDWLFVYSGKRFTRRMYHVLYSKKRDISQVWREFTKQKQFRDEKLVIYSNDKEILEKGVKTAMFAHDTDSTTFKLKTYIKTKHRIAISPKDSGVGFDNSHKKPEKSLNLHLNIEQLRKRKKDPSYLLMNEISKKVSFPLNSFLEAWEGDLSYSQGGTTIVKEKIIETKIDEDFNVTEVEGTQDKLVPNFALLFSINKNIHNLLFQLFNKGILRREEDKFRFLFSPSIKMKLTPSMIYFYSSDYIPKTVTSNQNDGILIHNKTKFAFQIDSMNQYESFGSIQIPIKNILQTYRNWGSF
jgi:hypothetical protein